jgi:hypothetical protein
MRTLYHYSCAHTREPIARAGRLMPLHDWRKLDRKLVEHGEAPSGLTRAPSVVWLTDLADLPNLAAIESLGLTSFLLDCDRTRYRYTVDGAGVLAWRDFVKAWRPNPIWLAMLEEFGAPDRWFVATFPLPIVETLDRYGALASFPRQEGR